MAFANDPLNLQATDGPTDVKKGESDAAAWLPPNNSFRCEYIARQIAVKATYDLWVTQAEHDAMAAVLKNCSSQLVPTNETEVVASAEAEPDTEAVVVAPESAAPRSTLRRHRSMWPRPRRRSITPIALRFGLPGQRRSAPASLATV